VCSPAFFRCRLSSPKVDADDYLSNRHQRSGRGRGCVRRRFHGYACTQEEAYANLVDSPAQAVRDGNDQAI